MQPDIARTVDIFHPSTLRAARPRDAHLLPTAYVHVAISPLLDSKDKDQSPSQPPINIPYTVSSSATHDSAVAAAQDFCVHSALDKINEESMRSFFSKYGQVLGVCILHPPASSTPSTSPISRLYCYIQYASKHQAVQAIAAVHLSQSRELGVRFYAQHAINMTETDSSSLPHPVLPPSSSSNSSSSSAPSSSASTSLSDRASASSVLPSGVHVITNAFSDVELADLRHPTSHQHKGDLSFGTALLNEDDKFGMKKPPPIPDAYHCLVERLKTGIDVGGQDGNLSMSITRITASILHPGQGLARTFHSLIYNPELLSIANIGTSHIVMELYRKNSPLYMENKHTILLPSNSLLLLTSSILSIYDYGIAAKTRDVIKEGKNGVNMKRGKCTLLFARHVVDIHAISSDPSPSSSSSSQHTLEQQKAAIIEQEREEKKIDAIAITVPGDGKGSVEDEEQAASLERIHVQQFYDSIATHFSNTRYAPWPKVEQFVKNIKAGANVADIGCGNGKYMGLNPSIDIIGCDSSANLVSICQARGYHAIIGDILDIPLQEGEFDVVLSIAVLHHLSTPSRRLKALSELLRITRPSGQILVSAWAYEQDKTSRRNFTAQDVLVSWKIPEHVVEKVDGDIHANARINEASVQAITQATNTINTTTTSPAPIAGIERTDDTEEKKSSGDAPSVMGEGLVSLQRYCHVYREGELESLISELNQAYAAPIARIVESYYDRGNWCILVEKL